MVVLIFNENFHIEISYTLDQKNRFNIFMKKLKLQNNFYITSQIANNSWPNLRRKS